MTYMGARCAEESDRRHWPPRRWHFADLSPARSDRVRKGTMLLLLEATDGVLESADGRTTRREPDEDPYPACDTA
jgi:hypothetical protein